MIIESILAANAFLEPMEQVEILRSNKGGAKIIHKGYMYTVHKRKSTQIRWRCSQRTLHCRGSIITGAGIPIVNIPHNHVPDMHAVAIARSRTLLLNEESDGPIDVIPLSAYDKNSPISNQDYNPMFSSMLASTSFADDHHTPDKYSYMSSDFDDTPVKIPPNPELKKHGAEKPPRHESRLPDDSEICLRWNSHHANMQSTIPFLMDNERYVDVTLAAEGKILKCHKVILSACSEYFDDLLRESHPMQHSVIYLKDTPYWIIKALVEFMYRGEVNVEQTMLEMLLKAAEGLQIKGLTVTNPSKPPIPPPEVNYFEPKEKLQKPVIKPAKLENNSILETDEESNHGFSKKVLPSKKVRKRKIIAPPNHAHMKQVKINLKGTKSRPNIKQPKFYDPDYPEYDPDRCVSPPKAESDPVFHIDNIKIEQSDCDSQDDQAVLYGTNSNTTGEKKLQNLKMVQKFVKVDNSVLMGQHFEKDGSKNKKQLVITSKDISDETRTFNADNPLLPTLQNQMTDKNNFAPSKELNLNKTAIIVQRQNIHDMLEDSSIRKIIDEANKSDGEAKKLPQIRVRNLPTTDTMLKKFATTNLTSILKKESGGPVVPPIVFKKMHTRPAILRHPPKKLETNQLANTSKLDDLAKTRKERISNDEDGMESSSNILQGNSVCATDLEESLLDVGKLTSD